MPSPICLRARRAAAVALVALTTLALVAPAVAARTLRPTVHSFYARDEGTRIHLALTFCEQDRGSDAADAYAATFRVWNAKGALLVKRQVTAGLDGSCGNANLLLRDRFTPGKYWANVAITNVTRQSFSRIKARQFVISASR